MTDATIEKLLKTGPFFASWSGGKDSCLAMHRAIRAGVKPACLFTMFTEGGQRSHSHGLLKEVILAQAAAMGLRAVSRAASWADYETAFIDGLTELRAAGSAVGVFGDIDLQHHLEWVQRVCRTAGVTAYEPLWQGVRRELLAEFMAAGFQATLVAVKGELLGPEFLGRTLDMELVGELESLGVDASGEKGEYHTVVTDGPTFSAPLKLERKGNVLRDGYWFLDVAVANS
jgi:uncharacterized protein (TIGR00290 family)